MKKRTFNFFDFGRIFFEDLFGIFTATMTRVGLYLIAFLLLILLSNDLAAYTHADTLRGSNGRGRDWWDVRKYSLSVEFDSSYKSIGGNSEIEFEIEKIPADSLQIDLQTPLIVDSVFLEIPNLSNKNSNSPFFKLKRGTEEGETSTVINLSDRLSNEGNVWWIVAPFHFLAIGKGYLLKIYYHGAPKHAENPPWKGGFTLTKDKNGKPWVAVSCQELGASAWWPCKDVQWDEPEKGMKLSFIVPGSLRCVSNGKYVGKSQVPGNKNKWEWLVHNPINNYDVTFYIGDYVQWHDTLYGENGLLDLDFWVLRDNLEKARKHFTMVRDMIHCYEYWMGPYPFYEDGYKLVEAPYLGMEHQSAIAYGNEYAMGYKGFDRTNTGVGMKFDYIIVHESGHEWFGNSVTAKDIADNWIQEGFTTFSECLYTECLLGKEKARIYNRGEWNNILNNRPMLGDYGVNNEGSGDIYDKGAAILWMIRKVVNNDEQFRQLLRGISTTFYHKTVATEEIEKYIINYTKLDLKAFFDQYLRTSEIPELEYYIKDKKLNFRFNKTVAGFCLPIDASSGEYTITLNPTTEWQQKKWKGGYDITFSKEFLITIK